MGQAAESLATARRLENLPVVDAAAPGRRAVCPADSGGGRAASADPSGEARLVAKAKTSSPAELREEP
ncbi:MAG TPA: hypothetical protein VG078_04140 [Acidimicrobiales bacterium]|nr:hypothetical protein [Acidimicrobiales bacterium]